MINTYKYLRNVYPSPKEYDSLIHNKAAPLLFKNHFLKSFKFDTVIGIIGHGGFGKVYHCVKNETDYAVKVSRFPACFLCSNDERNRLIRRLTCSRHEIEAGFKIGQSSSNPRIVPVLQFYPSLGEIDRQIDRVRKRMFVDSFYVLTVQPLGLPFDRFIRQNSRIMNGNLTQNEAVALSLDFLYALKSFHDKGIVHRDVKLNNFLLLKQNNEIHVALTDYGISRTVKKNQKFVKNVTILQSDAHLMRRKTRMHEHEDHSVDIRVDKLKHTDLYKTAVVIKSILTNSRFKQIDDILDRILDPNTRSITTEEVIKMFERLLSDSKKIEKAPKPEPKTRVYNPAPKKAETVSPREQSNVFKPFKG